MAPSDATPSPTAAPGLLAAAARERNSPPPSPPRSPPSDAGRGGESEAGAEGAGLGPSNQQMVWEMLYDPTYSLSTTEAVAAWQRASALAMGSPPPAGEGEDEAGEVDMESLSPEALTALLTRRAHMIAERAFWDSIAWRLQTGIQGGGLPQQLGPLLSELGLELGELLGDSLEGEALTQQFGERALMGRLTSRTGQQGGGANLTAVAGLLEQLMKALVPLGGAAHGNQVAEAAGAVQQQLVGALAAFADGGAADNTPSQAAGPLAEALTKALRLLMTQLKLVKLEAANTRLAALASAMKERGAVVYLRTKLAKEWGLPTGDQEGEGLTREVVGDKLPKTAAWVAEVAANKLPQVQQAMTAAGLLLPRDQAAAAVAAAAAATPVQLRAGLRSPTGSAPPRSPGSAPPSPGSSNGTASGGVGSTGLPVVYPADLDGWRGVTRLGLVSLVTGDAPAVGPALPELLQYDKERLHKAQNDLQQLLVLAGSLLIVQQLRAAAGRGWDAEGRAAARRRLMVVLADPNMRLGHLVTEISALAGATDPATESQVSWAHTHWTCTAASAGEMCVFGWGQPGAQSVRFPAIFLPSRTQSSARPTEMLAHLPVVMTLQGREALHFPEVPLTNLFLPPPPLLYQHTRRCATCSPPLSTRTAAPSRPCAPTWPWPSPPTCCWARPPPPRTAPWPTLWGLCWRGRERVCWRVMWRSWRGAWRGWRVWWRGCSPRCSRCWLPAAAVPKRGREVC